MASRKVLKKLSSLEFQNLRTSKEMDEFKANYQCPSDVELPATISPNTTPTDSDSETEKKIDNPDISESYDTVSITVGSDSNLDSAQIYAKIREKVKGNYEFLPSTKHDKKGVENAAFSENELTTKSETNLDLNIANNKKLEKNEPENKNTSCCFCLCL